MKSNELENATIKALTEGVVRKRTKKTETKKVEKKETNLVSSYDFKNDKTNPIWIVGNVTSNGKTYRVNAKVFLEGSKFGIDNGPISKLWIQGTDEKDYKPVVNYDRGWDIEPSEENKALYNEIMKLLVDFRNANPYEVDKTQEPKIESKKIEEVVKFTAYGKTYYEMSEDEYDNKSDEEIQATIEDTANQATEEEGHTVETDEVEILFENKSLVEKRCKYKLKENKLQEEWFGVKEATYQYNGDWSDPMVKYRGYLYDYYDIADFVYNCMVEDYNEEGKELPPENSKEYDDLFNHYMEMEVPNALYDLWPYKIDPDIIDYIEDGVVAGNAAEFIKKASNVDTSFEGVISRLESLKDNTDIPEKKIDKAIKVLKDDDVDKSDIVDSDDRLEELMPIVIEIISKVDDYGYDIEESKKIESKEVKTESDTINIKDDISETFNPSYKAFENNFGKIYIVKDKYDKLYKVYKENKLNLDDYIYYADNKDQIIGFLDGAIKANNGIFNK